MFFSKGLGEVAERRTDNHARPGLNTAESTLGTVEQGRLVGSEHSRYSGVSFARSGEIVYALCWQGSTNSRLESTLRHGRNTSGRCKTGIDNSSIATAEPWPEADPSWHVHAPLHQPPKLARLGIFCPSGLTIHHSVSSFCKHLRSPFVIASTVYRSKMKSSAG